VRLAEDANRARRLILEGSYRGGASHIGSCLSVIDILTVLYQDTRRDGDRILLSKGHAAAALYAALAVAGELDPDAFVSGFCADGSVFCGHPERGGVPGVQMTAGSLGHGLGIAVGMALANRADGSSARVFCVLGDGELNEGSVWEAAGLAGHHRLTSLTMIVDANGLQALGRVEDVQRSEPLAERLRTFGWDAVEVDGHDFDALVEVLGATGDKPRAVIARTVKGAGVPFMENQLMWHYKSLNEQQYDEAVAALPALAEAAR
jgi:transketolase